MYENADFVACLDSTNDVGVRIMCDYKNRSRSRLCVHFNRNQFSEIYNIDR